MSILDFSARRFLLPRMHREGRRFVLIAALLALLMGGLWWPLSLPGLLMVYGVYLFFRDPERVPPCDPLAVASPADGIICLLGQHPLPEQLGVSSEPVWRVSIFMSVLDVHVNRMPAAGRILKIVYIKGKFFNASMDKASVDNERMLYLMRTAGGQKLAFVQIAGLVARRIVSFVAEGQDLSRTERFGLIRFGSRVDVYLPQGVEPCVELGQIMVAGETTLARLSD